jgi:hypothetical protein
MCLSAQHDWSVVTRLVDVHYSEFGNEPTASRLQFWLRELRSPEPLVDVVQRAPKAATKIARVRAAIARALDAAEGKGTHSAIRLALREEEDQERTADVIYWTPLLKELEAMRYDRRRGRDPG